MKNSFVIANGDRETWELMVAPGLDEGSLEDEGYNFGLFLLENGSSSFLRGLARALDEAEIRKKTGLGY